MSPASVDLLDGKETGNTPLTGRVAAGRFEELKAILDEGRYFKVVCAAGNQDADEVYRLSLVYSLAGALGIDVSADASVVEASMRGVDKALEMARSLGAPLAARPFITVSVGLQGDPHVRKARIIEDLCTSCGACYENCDDNAIVDGPYRVLTRRCIGCGGCAEVCDADAVEFYSNKVDFRDVLPECIKAGAESIELHARIADDEAVMRDWRTVAEILPDQFISMCLDRSELSNSRLLRRISQAREVAGDRLIIQADGAPMSGGKDDFNTTLQAIDCADVILKSDIDARILLSGGTNSKTGELAAMCGVVVHGVSVGTFARNLVREEIDLPDFDSNEAALRRAVAKAKRLVDANIERLSRAARPAALPPAALPPVALPPVALPPVALPPVAPPSRR